MRGGRGEGRRRVSSTSTCHLVIQIALFQHFVFGDPFKVHPLSQYTPK